MRPAAWLRRGWLHLLLPLALLAAQSLGLLHGVLHPHAGMGSGAAGLHAAATGAGSHPAGVVHHDDGSALCRLVDHLGHADLLPPPVPALLQAARPPLAPAPVPQGVALSLTTAYDARGPPATATS